MSILIAAAAGSQVLGGIIGGQASKSAYDEQADMHEANARILDEKAKQKRREALDEQILNRDQADRALKSMKVGFAKSGAGVSLVAMLKAAENMGYDIINIATSRENEAMNIERSGRIEMQMHNSAHSAGKLSMTTSLISGISGAVTTAAMYKYS